MDSSLYQWINDLQGRSSWAHGPMTFYADWGIVLFAGLLLVAFLVARSCGDLEGVAGSVWAGGAAVVALGIAQVVNAIVDRPRPYVALADVHVLISRTTDSTFPSDHSTAVGAVAVGLWFVNRRIGVVAVVGALLMGFTRVYVGAHYPLDVVAGLALGGAVAAAGHRWLVPWLERLARHITGTRVRWLVTAQVTPAAA
jgi:undecaprenyl-diphosphatase